MPYPSTHARSVGLISPKGGSGTTVTAAALALLSAEQEPTWLLGSDDSAAALGIAEPLDSSVEAIPGLVLSTPRGRLEDAPPADARVIIDGGFGATTLMVLRPCYLALRRACLGPRPDGLVLLAEPGRALTPADAERAVGAPIRAIVEVDPKTAMLVDAGLLSSRLPAGLRQPLSALLSALSSPAPLP